MADDDDLALLFATARRLDQPSADLQARAFAAATAMQPIPAVVPSGATSHRSARGAGFLREVWQALGGWHAAGGLSAAMLVGFWLGLNDPSGLLGQFGNTDSVELMPGADDVFAELTDEG